MIANFEEYTSDKLQRNAITFLKDGLNRLVSSDTESDVINEELLILTCTSLQISIELATKALIIKKLGFRCILNPKQRKLTDRALILHFQDNKIRTLDFDVQKNLVKSKNLIEDFSKEEFKIIEKFQQYRNKIVHFSYEFAQSDLNNIKSDIIYYFVHVIFKILSAQLKQEYKPSEFLQYVLGGSLHRQLLDYLPYVTAMKNLAQEHSAIVLKCVICNNKTLSQDDNYCYCCNFYNHDFTLIDCDYCEVKKCVIYDNLNIYLNKNEARGLCLNCDEDGIIYECPNCNKAYNMETSPYAKCDCNKK